MVAEGAQVLGDVRLTQAELADQVADRLLSIEQQVQDLAALRLSQYGKSVHRPNIRATAYTSYGI